MNANAMFLMLKLNAANEPRAKADRLLRVGRAKRADAIRLLDSITDTFKDGIQAASRPAKASTITTFLNFYGISPKVKRYLANIVRVLGEITFITVM